MDMSGDGCAVVWVWGLASCGTNIYIYGCLQDFAAVKGILSCHYANAAFMCKQFHALSSAAGLHLTGSCERVTNMTA